MTQTLEPQTDPLPSDGSAPEPAKRPIAVTVVSVVAIVIAVLSLILAVADLYVVVADLRRMPASSWVFTEQHIAALAIGIVLLITAPAMLVTAVALLRMHRWAWSVLMTLVALGLTGGLVGYFSGRGVYPDMLLNATLAFALSRVAVQEAFGIRRAGP